MEAQSFLPNISIVNSFIRLCKREPIVDCDVIESSDDLNNKVQEFIEGLMSGRPVLMVVTDVELSGKDDALLTISHNPNWVNKDLPPLIYNCQILANDILPQCYSSSFGNTSDRGRISCEINWPTSHSLGDPEDVDRVKALQSPLETDISKIIFNNFQANALYITGKSIFECQSASENRGSKCLVAIQSLIDHKDLHANILPIEYVKEILKIYNLALSDMQLSEKSRLQLLSNIIEVVFPGEGDKLAQLYNLVSEKDKDANSFMNKIRSSVNEGFKRLNEDRLESYESEENSSEAPQEKQSRTTKKVVSNIAKERHQPSTSNCRYMMGALTVAAVAIASFYNF